MDTNMNNNAVAANNVDFKFVPPSWFGGVGRAWKTAVGNIVPRACRAQYIRWYGIALVNRPGFSVSSVVC